MSTVASVEFQDYNTSVTKALDLIAAAGILPQSGLIIIKPNLTNADKPPVTTDVRAVEAVYRYCAMHSKAEIAVGEGCGSGTTAETLKANGYTELAARHGIRLIDFNREETVELERDDTFQLRKFHMPVVVQDAFVISVPVLKDHCFTVTTVAMKNMFGIAPEPYYSGSWNKSKLHHPSTHKSVVDVCLYKKPGLSVVDASVALSGMHLSGTPRKLDRIVVGVDPVAVDAVASELLGHSRNRIEYLKLANGRLGDMDNVEIVT